MSATEQQLRDSRQIRNAARALFDADLKQVKTDLAARSIGGRIADQASEEVNAALAEGMAVAKESKGIVAGTLAALLAWFFRGPILEAIEGRLSRDPEPDPPAPVQVEPVKSRRRPRKTKETGS